ncbi:ATP synthase F0, B subunit [candidate division TM7 genomosp. GTL1]|nr:ATP synthase F0, B subunit [candidate division TM7 genomosp. GTL1]
MPWRSSVSLWRLLLSLFRFMKAYALHIVAATESHGSSGLFEALGINWQLLGLQALAFVILVVLLGKFVYPKLIGAIDAREKAIFESLEAAQQAESKAEEVEEKVKKLLTEARKEAADIVAVAKKEAAAEVGAAEAKAKKRAEHIVAEAQEQLGQEVNKARLVLRKETTELVALATEKIVREKVDADRDAKLIEAALKEAK